MGIVMRNVKIPFSAFIKRVNEFKLDGFLYTKSGLIDTIQDLLISFDEYSFDNIEDFQWTLSCYDVVDIIENLNQQRENPTDQEYLKAINFYIKNDAFIDLENEVH
jgi:hypothetical protein